MKYDDASWHLEGDFPPGLPEQAGSTHIALFFAWAALNGLASGQHAAGAAKELARLRSRAADPYSWFAATCDAQLTDEDLSEEGNAFARDYYGDATGLNTGEAGYLADYERRFPGLPSLYHVPTGWMSYDRIAPVLTRRLRGWRLRRFFLRLTGR